MYNVSMYPYLSSLRCPNDCERGRYEPTLRPIETPEGEKYLCWYCDQSFPPSHVIKLRPPESKTRKTPKRKPHRMRVGPR